MSERQGVEIDYCPQCRGIWLDRGELDKILDRVQAETASMASSAAAPAAAPPTEPQRGSDERYADRRRDDGYDRRRDSRSGYRKKKQSPFDFLGDIFES